MPSGGLRRHQTCKWCTDIHVGKTLIHTKNFKKKKLDLQNTCASYFKQKVLNWPIKSVILWCIEASSPFLLKQTCDKDSNCGFLKAKQSGIIRLYEGLGLGETSRETASVQVQGQRLPRIQQGLELMRCLPEAGDRSGYRFCSSSGG